MGSNRPARRSSLRQLLTHAEKCSRESIEQVESALLPTLRELNQLAQHPIAYPAVAELVETLRKLMETDQETRKLADVLQQQFQEIREHLRQRRPAKK